MFLASDDSIDNAIHDIRSALAKEPVDLLIRNVTLVNVYSEEMHAADIAVRRHRIVAIRENFDGEAKAVIDATGQFIMPGAVEPYSLGHAFGDERALIERGVTSVIVPPGQGNRFSDLSVWVLGETAKPIQPDAVAGSSGEALDYLRNGTLPIVDAGSCTDWQTFFREIAARSIDSGRFVLAQSARPEDPVTAAVASGQKPARARQLVSFNAAIHYSLDHEIGGIAPGRQADIVLSASPTGRPEMVIIRGKVAFRR